MALLYCNFVSGSCCCSDTTTMPPPTPSTSNVALVHPFQNTTSKLIVLRDHIDVEEEIRLYEDICEVTPVPISCSSGQNVAVAHYRGSGHRAEHVSSRLW